MAKKVVLMCRVCMHLRVASKAFMEVWATLAKYASKQQTEEEQRESSKAAFDVQYFKTQHNRFPIRAIQVAMKVPEQRSMEDLELVLTSLRTLLSIRHYSKSYQLTLAKIMRYERFRRRRVIMKKGQNAHSFYFIYSGGVSFTTDEDGSSAFEEEHQADLRKGARFGEIPVLKGLQRNFTAVCMDDTELLVVDKEDFFGNRLDQALVEESHHRFIFFRSLSLLDSLPDSSIEILSDYSTTEEFLYGQVIPHNMDHVIFVIKGRFAVLRLVDLTQCPSYHRFIIHELPFLKSTIHKMDSGVDRQLLNLTVRTGSMHRDLEHSSKSLLGIPSVTSIQIHPPEDSRSMKDLSTSNSTISVTTVTPISSKTQQQVKAKSESRKQLKLDSAVSTSTLEDSSHMLGKTSRKQMIPRALAVAVYMKIDSIVPGEVFGLQQYFVADNLKDRRNFTIKSQGTKIVRINMRSLAELTDQQTLQKVRKLTSVYPSDDELCDLFIKNNYWKIFKKNMIAKLTSKPQRFSLSGQIAESGRGEDLYEIDKAGILNLPEIASNRNILFSKPPYYVAPIIRTREEGSTPVPKLDLQLIHGIAKFPPSTANLLY
ncbi:cyclic nucleotide-binding domain-containing protein 2-like [Stegostoma tigrinum]|uniref:cyclic nucleotide-binding domain-containing protein 2-like n=1 Tax=Stegostoma tigrinum TaxID=3053191 RepID=UPI0028706248|nr:cyclic nucleotide-binding domain-containing protein 2-like [Stegostoma tigrinum]